MCITPHVSNQARLDSYMDQQTAFYEKALIMFYGDHAKAFAVAIGKIQEFIMADGMDPRDYWAYLDKEASL